MNDSDLRIHLSFVGMIILRKKKWCVFLDWWNFVKDNIDFNILLVELVLSDF